MEPSRQSHRLRGNLRGQLTANLRAQDLPVNEVMLQNVHIWDTDLRKNTQNHNAGVTNRDHNAAIVAQADSIVQLHGRACDVVIQTPYLFAHGILEIANDTATRTNIALTNKAMWRKCKNALDMEGMGTKFWVNIPQRHRQIGRPIDSDEEFTPSTASVLQTSR